MNKKSMAKNSFYNILYKMLNVFYPLVTSAYVSRVLLPEGVGRIAFVQTIVSYFTTIAALGIPNYGIKIIGGVQNDLKERSVRFCELFVINMCSSLICYVVFLVSLKGLSSIADGLLLFVLGFQILLNIINVDWFYQGMEEYGYIAIRSTIVKFFSLFLMLVLVKNENDCVVYCIILCLATVGNYFFNIIHIRKYIKFSFKRLNVKKHLKPVFILLASVCATEVYTMLDSTMIGLFCTERELGYYSNAIKIIRLGFSVIGAMCAVFLPRLSYLHREKMQCEFQNLADTGLKLAMYFAIPCTVGLFIDADLLVMLLYGQAFAPAVKTVRILAILLFIFSFAYIAGHVILIATNQESSILVATVSAAIINFILNLLLIKLYLYNGAAIATIIAETIVTIILYLKTKPYVIHNIQKKYWISIFVSTIIMSIVVGLCRMLIRGNLYQFIGSVLLGAFVYFMCSIMLKNDIAEKGLEVLKQFCAKS